MGLALINGESWWESWDLTDFTGEQIFNGEVEILNSLFRFSLVSWVSSFEFVAWSSEDCLESSS